MKNDEFDERYIRTIEKQSEAISALKKIIKAFEKDRKVENEDTKSPEDEMNGDELRESKCEC